MLQEHFRHGGIIDDTHRRTLFAALYSLGDLLQHTVAQVIVDFHFRITGKLEGISLEVCIVLTAENKRQAASDDIIQISQIALSVFVVEAHKASADRYREFQKGIFRLFAA